MKKPLHLFAIATAIAFVALPLAPGHAMGTDSSDPAKVSPSDKTSTSIEKKVTKLSTALELSADEQSKIKAILVQEADQVKQIKDDKTLSKADHAARLKQIHADTKGKIASVLTADQQKKFALMGPGHRSAPIAKS